VLVEPAVAKVWMERLNWIFVGKDVSWNESENDVAGRV